MNTDEHGFRHGELTRRIIGVFYEVYNELGQGFLESVYAKALSIALGQTGLSVVSEAPIQVRFRGELVGEFRADLVVEGTVLIELKAARAIDSSHEAQVLNYLRASDIEVGMLLNFGPKPEFKRLMFDNQRKLHRAPPPLPDPAI